MTFIFSLVKKINQRENITMLPPLAVFDYVRKLFASLETLSNSSNSELDQTKQFHLRALNYLGISYALGYSLLLFVLTYFVTIPFAYEDGSGNHDEESISSIRYLTIYIYFNFIANYVLLRYGAAKSIYCTPRDLPYYSVTTREDWKMCKQCNQDVPARTHHCPLCNMCVLKRDHHCFFVGCCVGFHNQRYFICCAFHTLLCCALSFYFMMLYLSAHYVTFLGPEFFKYFLPYALVVWLFGSTTFGIFFYILIFYLNITTLLASIFFFIWQFNLVKGGQTSYEFVKGKKTYQTNLLTSIRSVFGPFWILNFIFPMPCIKNEGDGKTWMNGNTKYL